MRLIWMNICYSSLIISSALAACPSAEEPNSGACFWYQDTSNYVSYSTAENNCAQSGAHLPVVDTQQKFNHIYSILISSFWLDLHYQSSGSCTGWCWRGTKSVSTGWTNWESGTPSGSEKCAYHSELTHSDRWAQKDCTATSLTLCQSYNCGSPPSVSNAVLTSTSNGAHYAKSAVYTCNTGHYFSGGTTTATSTCLVSGTWSSVGSCITQDCGTIPALTNGQVASTAGTPKPHTVTYQCNTGYYFPSGAVTQITCPYSGTWSASPSACVAVDCGTVPLVNNAGVISSTGTTYTETSSYQCLSGYQFTDGSTTATTTCLANSSWSFIDDCFIVDCGTAPLVNNAGVISSTGTTYTKTSSYQCLSGYKFTDGLTTATTTCLANSSWSFIDHCFILDCGSPPAVVDAYIISTTNNQFGGLTKYECSVGNVYLFNGLRSGSKFESTCTANGTWEIPGICTTVDCGTAPSVNNAGVISSTGTAYTNTSSYQCLSGYKFTDGLTTGTTTCLANSSWSLIDHCYIVDCGSPPAVVDAYIIATTNNQFGGLTKYECIVGNVYLFNGLRSGSKFESTCTASGTWENTGICTIASQMETTFVTGLQSVTNQQTTTVTARSKIHCASLCVKEQCNSFEYDKPQKLCNLYVQYKGTYGVQQRIVT